MVGKRFVSQSNRKHFPAAHRRPKRNVPLKTIDDAVGLSKKEEKELKKALYASLQETKLKVTYTYETVIDRRYRGGNNKSEVNTAPSTPEPSPRRPTLVCSNTTSIDESSQDSLKSYTSTNTTTNSTSEPFRAKVHAQRKFAQGSLPVTPSTTPIKNVTSPFKLLPKTAKTEDFLTFLCLRGTSVLPPHLDFLNFSREETGDSSNKAETATATTSASKTGKQEEVTRESTPESSSASSNDELYQLGTPSPSTRNGGISSALRKAARASASTPETARGIVSLYRQGLSRKASGLTQTPPTSRSRRSLYTPDKTPRSSQINKRGASLSPKPRLGVKRLTKSFSSLSPGGKLPLKRKALSSSKIGTKKSIFRSENKRQIKIKWCSCCSHPSESKSPSPGIKSGNNCDSSDYYSIEENDLPQEITNNQDLITESLTSVNGSNFECFTSEETKLIGDSTFAKQTVPNKQQNVDLNILDPKTDHFDMNNFRDFVAYTINSNYVNVAKSQQQNDDSNIPDPKTDHFVLDNFQDCTKSSNDINVAKSQQEDHDLNILDPETDHFVMDNILDCVTSSRISNDINEEKSQQEDDDLKIDHFVMNNFWDCVTNPRSPNDINEEKFREQVNDLNILDPETDNFVLDNLLDCVTSSRISHYVNVENSQQEDDDLNILDPRTDNFVLDNLLNSLRTSNVVKSQQEVNNLSILDARTGHFVMDNLLDCVPRSKSINVQMSPESKGENLKFNPVQNSDLPILDTLIHNTKQIDKTYTAQLSKEPVSEADFYMNNEKFVLQQSIDTQNNVCNYSLKDIESDLLAKLSAPSKCPNLSAEGVVCLEESILKKTEKLSMMKSSDLSLSSTYNDTFGNQMSQTKTDALIFIKNKSDGPKAKECLICLSEEKESGLQELKDSYLYNEIKPNVTSNICPVIAGAEFSPLPAPPASIYKCLTEADDSSTQDKSLHLNLPPLILHPMLRLQDKKHASTSFKPLRPPADKSKANKNRSRRNSTSSDRVDSRPSRACKRTSESFDTSPSPSNRNSKSRSSSRLKSLPNSGKKFRKDYLSDDEEDAFFLIDKLDQDFRKRGRPKGSKNKKKLGMAMATRRAVFVKKTVRKITSLAKSAAKKKMAAVNTLKKSSIKEQSKLANIIQKRRKKKSRELSTKGTKDTATRVSGSPKTKLNVSKSNSPDKTPPKSRKKSDLSRSSLSERTVKMKPFPKEDERAEIVDIPVFYPTEQEFQDPITYIESIKSTAETYGMCKIVPPNNWKPDSKANEDMRFTAQVQYTHKLYNRWGPNVEKTECILKHLRNIGVEFDSVPKVGSVELDLPRLSQIIQEHGGMQNVIDKKKWIKIADILNIPKMAVDRGTKLFDVYCKYLLPYDTLSVEEKRKVKQHVLADKQKKEQMNETDDGIVKGKSSPLSAFIRVARNVQSMWFKDEPSAEQMESVYWKLLEEGKQHVAVQCGHVNTRTQGTAFPAKRDNPYFRHNWNLNNLPQNPKSLLNVLSPITGTTIPTLHIGMLFATSCWSCNPHNLPYIQYLHSGADIVWYSVPKHYEEKLKEAMIDLTPDLISDDPQWLKEDVVMINPDLLVEHNVPVGKCVQQPRQFVVIFNKSYTATVSCGYNVSESAHYATPQWLPLGVQAAKDLNESYERELFSMDCLLYSLAINDNIEKDTLSLTLKYLEKIVNEEISLRRQLYDGGIKIFGRMAVTDDVMMSTYPRKRIQDLLENEENVCDISKKICYLSMVTNDVEKTTLCLQEALQHIPKKKNLKSWRLLYRYTDEELQQLIEKTKKRLNDNNTPGKRRAAKKI